MKQLLLLFVMSIPALNAMGQEKHADAYDLIVNLGGDCQVSHQMKKNNIRNCALPFDYLVTPEEGLLKLLLNNFDNFLAENNLSIAQESERPYIRDTGYNINLIHDFELVDNTIANYTAVKEKYDRRIKRLFDLIEQGNKILFIRKRVTKEGALALSNLLKSLFPTKTFTVLALDCTDEIKEDWQIEGVKNMFLRQPEPYVWTGDDQAWKEIFAQFTFNLLPVYHEN